MSEKQLRHLSRREIIKLGLTAAIGTGLLDILVAHAGGSALTRPFWEELETGTLSCDVETYRIALEGKYGIHLLQTDKIFREKYSHQLTEIQMRRLGVRINWPAPQLKILDEGLSILPEHFYSPRLLRTGKYRPLTLSLIDSHLRSTTTLAPDKYEEDIRYEMGHLRTTIFEKRDAIDVITHELAHIVSTQPFFQEVAMGLKTDIGLNSLADLRSAFTGIIKEKDHADVLYEYQLLNWRDPIGYGATNFDEFWSVASEYYLDGRNSCIKAYSKYLGEARSTRLYDGIKAGIFRGKEY